MLLKNRKPVDIGLAILFLFFLVCYLFYVKGYLEGAKHEIPQYALEDEYDSSLSRLNSVSKLTAYCDSFYQADFPKRTYPGIVSEVIRKRFYHGYSYYNLGNNPLGVMLEPLVGNGATAIVMPDDIIKNPHAACSQQSIVGMELFKRKGYPVRKVSMYDSITNSGHFAYEVFYDKSWHFFDTDQEPDAEVLRRYNRPSISFLAANPNIVLEAYHTRKDPQLFKRLLTNFKLGPINRFPAPNAYLYQVITKYISYFGWLFFLIVILVRYIIKKRINSNRLLSRAKQKDSVAVLS